MGLLIWNLAFGVVSAFFTIISGLREAKTLVHNDMIHGIMKTHELLGYIFSGLFLIVLVWMIMRESIMRLPEFTSIVILLVLASGLLVFGAHLGGRLVYEEGAGVLPMEKVITGEDHNQLQNIINSELPKKNDSGDLQENTMENHDTHEHDHSSHEH